MGSDERGTQIENFKRGRVRTLISTDMLSLGIDFTEVDIVINYDVPVLGISRLDWETRMRSIDHGYVVSLVANEQEKDFKELKHRFIMSDQIIFAQDVNDIISAINGQIN
jgi:superfamily II DNA/RNA helicase